MALVAFVALGLWGWELKRRRESRLAIAAAHQSLKELWLNQYRDDLKMQKKDLAKARWYRERAGREQEFVRKMWLESSAETWDTIASG
jgi:hypothetical protein